jgi:hypothetical protein
LFLTEPRREKAGWPLLNVINVGGVLVILILLISTNFASRLFEDHGPGGAVILEPRTATDPTTGLPITVGGPEEMPGIMWRVPPSRTHVQEDDLLKRQIQHLEVQMRTGDGFRIIVRVTAESPSTIHVPPRDGDFDFSQLTDELFKIKQAYESRQDIYLAGADDVPYGKFLKAVAACRDKVVEGEGQKMTYPLFPVVHFTDLPE